MPRARRWRLLMLMLIDTSKPCATAAAPVAGHRNGNGS
jgi:hypothetical protein